MKLKLLSLSFLVLCIENTFRVLDYVFEWSSDASKQAKLENWREQGPSEFVWIGIIMSIMILNVTIWNRRTIF